MRISTKSVGMNEFILDRLFFSKFTKYIVKIKPQDLTVPGFRRAFRILRSCNGERFAVIRREAVRGIPQFDSGVLDSQDIGAYMLSFFP